MNLKQKIELYFKSITRKSELDLIVQLLFKFNLKEELESFFRKKDFYGAVSCSFAYIDKRPIVGFEYDSYDKNIELGDVLFLLKRHCHVLSRNERSNHPIFRNSIFIQAKKTNELELKPRSRQEGKQFFLYEKWPSFQLVKPKKIGPFQKGMNINFDFKNSNNPGTLMKLTDEYAPSFFCPDNLKNEIGIDDFFEKLNRLVYGKRFDQNDCYSEFVNTLYESSKKSVFKRATIFPKAQSRTTSFLTSRNLNLYSFQDEFSKDFKPEINSKLLCFKLILKSAMNFFLRRKGFLVIELDVMMFDY